jgi:heme/copper-type cytochrome/quinol oxidase subunit 3
MAETATAVDPPDEILRIDQLAVGSIGRKASGWWGMLTLIATEAALFSYLLFTYYFLAIENGRNWLPQDLPQFRLSAPNTVLLLLSSVAVLFAQRGLRKSRLQLVGGLLVGLLMGAGFVWIQFLEWMSKPFGLSSDSYSSTYFVITGLHMAHVVAGLLMLAALSLWSALGYFDQTRSAHVHAGAIYWHFVDAIWLTLFFTFYITPRLGL